MPYRLSTFFRGGTLLLPTSVLPIYANYIAFTYNVPITLNIKCEGELEYPYLCMNFELEMKRVEL